MYERHLSEPPPERRSVDQLRGIESSPVRKLYQMLARRPGGTWHGRDHRPEWGAAAPWSERGRPLVQAG